MSQGRRRREERKKGQGRSGKEEPGGRAGGTTFALGHRNNERQPPLRKCEQTQV